MHPPPLPARANFTLMTECTPESSGCYSVYSYSVGQTLSIVLHYLAQVTRDGERSICGESNEESLLASTCFPQCGIVGSVYGFR